MSKQRESRLDNYADTLLAMDAEKKTLAEILEWLRDEGVVCSLSTLSRFLESARSRQLQSRLLDQISSGAAQVREIEKQFGSNPAPDMETIIKLHRVLILNLTTQGNSNPELLKLADQLTRTALEFTSGKTKAEQKRVQLEQTDRRIQLLEKKAAAFDRAQAALESAKSSKGGITPETLKKIETELRLL